MSTQITFLGHSAFEIRTGDESVLIDPFLSGNPQASTTAGEFSPGTIVLSHAHADHVGDTIDIAKRCGAKVIANYEIIQWVAAQGIENVHPQSIGGAFNHDFGRLKLTIAHHGSMFDDGSNGGQPAGLLFSLDGATIYHAGDTALFSDMSLIGEAGLDVAILPIGDNFTMGPEDAVRAVELLRPRVVVPCHYNTFPVIEQDPEAWASMVRERTDAEPRVLQPGESLSVG